MTINRQVLVGLIGGNIMKSLSPALHIDALAAAGFDGFYHLMDVDQLAGRSLKQLLDAARTAGFAGTNVTFPFKQEVMALLDDIDAEAKQIGAVNTVTFGADGKMTGYNTDRRGFGLSFQEGLGKAAAEGKSVVQVGAGGAGRAVAFAMMDLGVSKLVLHDRDANQAQTLKADLAAYYDAARCVISSDLAAEVVAADGVVNATPVGMHGIPGNPVPAELHKGQWAADVIYSPIETAFIKSAMAKGCRVLTGGGMCVHQAAEAFRLFTGIQPDTARMHRTFAEALARRDAGMKEAV